MTCTLLAATYLPYVVTVGGDFMRLHRFIMPIFVVAAVTVTLGLLAAYLHAKVSTDVPFLQFWLPGGERIAGNFRRRARDGQVIRSSCDPHRSAR